MDVYDVNMLIVPIYYIASDSYKVQSDCNMVISHLIDSSQNVAQNWLVGKGYQKVVKGCLIACTWC